MILPPLLHLAAAALAAALAGCSHTAPYYRADVAGGAAGPALPAEDLAFRVILIGDAGAPGPREPVLATLKAWARRDPDRTLVAFLGDNVYEDGFLGADRRDEERRLERQLETLEGLPGPRGLFIPGNHDWAGGSEAGLAALKAQQEYVEARLSPGSFLPRDGRPGPVKIDLPDSAGAVLRLVAVDSQWWLHEGPKPVADRNGVGAALVRCLTTDLPVVVLAHHPLESAGNHGGFFDWRDCLFPATRATDAPWAWLIPAPLVYPLGRRFTPLGTGQDIFAPAYRQMKEDRGRSSGFRSRPAVVRPGGAADRADDCTPHHPPVHETRLARRPSSRSARRRGARAGRPHGRLGAGDHRHRGTRRSAFATRPERCGHRGAYGAFVLRFEGLFSACGDADRRP